MSDIFEVNLKEGPFKNVIKTKSSDRADAITSSTQAHEIRFAAALGTNLAECEFTPHEQKTQARIESRFQNMARQSGGDSNIYLENLQKLGVAVIADSAYLDYLDNLSAKANRYKPHQGAYFDPTTLAAFLEKRGKELSEETRRELETALNSPNGAIFLAKNPSALARWHEGVHAIQHLEGWDFTKSQKAKDEVSVNVVLVKSHSGKLLPDVSKGNYFVTDNDFGKPFVYPETNDIYKELDDMEINLEAIKSSR